MREHDRVEPAHIVSREPSRGHLAERFAAVELDVRGVAAPATAAAVAHQHGRVAAPVAVGVRAAVERGVVGAGANLCVKKNCTAAMRILQR